MRGEKGESGQELEMLREKYQRILEIFADGRRIVNVADLLNFKKGPRIEDDSVFLEEIVQRTKGKRVETGVVYTDDKGAKKPLTGWSGKSEEIRRTLRPFSGNDIALMEEFLKLPESIKESLGVAVHDENLDQRIQDTHFYRVIKTPGELLKLLEAYEA